jgi:hypothetical protein
MSGSLEHGETEGEPAGVLPTAVARTLAERTARIRSGEFKASPAGEPVFVHEGVASFDEWWVEASISDTSEVRQLTRWISEALGDADDPDGEDDHSLAVWTRDAMFHCDAERQVLIADAAGDGDILHPLRLIGDVARVTNVERVAGVEEIRGVSTTRYSGELREPSQAAARFLAAKDREAVQVKPVSVWIDEEGRIRRTSQRLWPGHTHSNERKAWWMPSPLLTASDYTAEPCWRTTELWDFGITVEPYTPTPSPPAGARDSLRAVRFTWRFLRAIARSRRQHE